MADVRSPLQRGFHSSLILPPIPLPSRKGPEILENSTSMVSWQPVVGTSQASGISPGNTLPTRCNLHRLTESLHAVTIAAGESLRKSQVAPSSSMAVEAEDSDQPILCTEQSKAATGPVTELHRECLQLASFADATKNVLCRVSSLNHLSHHAVAQCLRGKVCASNAGSSVPAAPSKGQ